ncbi:MAG: PIN domain-containing protein [Propionibacteriaceae bacterium]|jgi:predicted nucleic acid-binding protein|nr:PIN domain-containing protein [Propionibacteriaceae bacterium]
MILIDNSVWQRVGKESVGQTVAKFIEKDSLATCLQVELERGYSARSPQEYHQQIEAARAAMVFLAPDSETADIALRMQAALFDSGKGRAAGVADIQIAAACVRHGVLLIHYDHDFEYLASVEPALRAQWVVEPGTAD